MSSQSAGVGEMPSRSIWSAQFVALIFVSFLYSMGQVTINTILPLYAYDLGISASIIGTVIGAFAITALCIRPFSGPAFDSFSKRKLLMAVYALTSVCTFLYAFASTVPQLLVLRLFHGAGIGCANALCLAMASETLPPERMSSGISIFTLAQALAQTVAPALSIWLSRIIGYAPTFMASAASMVAALLVVVFVLRDPEGVTRPPYQIRLDRIIAKRAIVPAVILLFFSMSYSSTGSFVAIYGGLRGVEQIGLYFTVYAACMLVTRPVFGRLSDRFGINAVLFPSMACFALSFALLKFSDSLTMFMLSGAVAACGYGGSLPLVQTLVFKCVPKGARGSGSNTSYIGMDIGAMCGPVIGGWVIEAFMSAGASEVVAFSQMWLVMIVPVALAFVFLLTQRSRLARYEAEAREI